MDPSSAATFVIALPELKEQMANIRDVKVEGQCWILGRHSVVQRTQRRLPILPFFFPTCEDRGRRSVEKNGN